MLTRCGEIEGNVSQLDTRDHTMLPEYADNCPNKVIRFYGW